ncbi:MAG: DNA mismatch repair protein MutS [Eubacteriales bacterium]|nr:DNA mismatch repair protein MutS [Eubacteriales bacterium]
MKLTPMMQQYRETKEQYPDCLLMFRVGDFFELFFEDAVIASRELNIALTSRDKKEGEKGTPMAGVPHHALDAYLGKLVKSGYKVAICDQVEDPQLAKGLVKREVVRVITPGTIIEDNLLEPTENNWLLALVRQQEEWGLAFTDISTGQFQCSQFAGSLEQVESIIASLNPREIISDEKADSLGFPANSQVEAISPEQISSVSADLPREHFLHAKPLAAKAAALILTYLRDRQMAFPEHPGDLAWYDPGSFMYLDATSQRNLEILAPLGGNSSGPSLLKVVDKTITAMGSRKLKNILIAPLADAAAIEKRLDSVEFFFDNYVLRKKARELLRDIYDLERIVTKINYKSANARDLLALARSLQLVPSLAELVAAMPGGGPQQLGDYSQLCALIFRAIQPEPPVSVRDGNIIRQGYSQELDEIRQLAASGSSWIRKYEGKLRDETGIKSLKIGFNKVFGYYIEVTRTHLDLAPDWFIRKQTLVNCERFETEELKQWEDKILSANDRKQSLEYQLFCALREETGKWSPQIQATARALAALDCWQALAETAAENNYCRPVIDDSSALDIRDGRHPVVEQFGIMQFVANDCLLDTHSRQIMIITGPNMAGKSTYMRQVALIALLAQAGSFVPASYARIGVLDAIFTRIGASDDLASGRSTFMVEMAELARILARATPRSLILLDEIGRGTGTADGISIARATLEYLHNKPAMAAKTLFATHYHQLTGLAEELGRVINCSIQVSEKEGEVTFLHKIVAGGSDRSYGIHVAKLAGLPQELVTCAESYISEEDWPSQAQIQVAAAREDSQPQLKSVVKILQALNLDEISPRQAWTELDRLKRLAAEVKINED